MAWMFSVLIKFLLLMSWGIYYNCHSPVDPPTKAWGAISLPTNLTAEVTVVLIEFCVGDDSMAVKLYGAYYAPNANRALVVLHEKEVEFELVPVITLNGDQKKPEYMALQPFGVVPLLQDGDVQVYESRAITRYIADKYEGQGTPNLHGTTLAERAQVEQWLEVENGTFSPLLKQLFRQLFYMPGIFNTPPDQLAVAELEQQLGKVLDIYEAQLSQHTYLAGEFVSIADLAHLSFAYPYLDLLQRRELLQSRKRVAEWWTALSSRPAWLRVAALAAPVYGPWLQRVHACVASESPCPKPDGA